jgi:hypothetical protein
MILILVLRIVYTRHPNNHFYYDVVKLKYPYSRVYLPFFSLSLSLSLFLFVSLFFLFLEWGDDEKCCHIVDNSLVGPWTLYASVCCDNLVSGIYQINEQV